MRTVFDFSGVSWTHLLCLMPSYISAHYSVYTSDSSCEKPSDKKQNWDFNFFTSFVALVPRAKDAVYVPAPADSLGSHGHKHYLSDSRVSRFSRRAADPSSEIAVGSASVFTPRPDMASVPQQPPRESPWRHSWWKGKEYGEMCFCKLGCLRSSTPPLYYQL